MKLPDSKKNIAIVFTVFLAAGLSFFIGTENVTRIGLYEYVRKAENHMDRGRYERALHYLHKAHDSAPENPSILDELLHGYLQYARYLNSKGDIEEAILQTATAFEMSRDSMPVVNDLSYYLASGAVEKAFRGDIRSAEEDLKIVRILSLKHGRVRRNMANYLFNRAVEARDKGKEDVLFLCLKSSYDIRPGFEAAMFLARSFYDLRDMRKALHYWKQALSIRPGSYVAVENIERLKREMELEPDVEVIHTADFEILLYTDKVFDRDELKEHLYIVYGKVGRDLGYYLSPGTGIVLYDEDDFRRIFRKSGIIRGFYDGNIRIAVKGNAREILETGLIAHEFTHAVISAVTDNRCPVWLHEGIAVYQQSEYMPPNLERLRTVVKRGDLIRINDLERYFSDIEDHFYLVLAYEASYSAVVFMLEQWGWEGMRRLLEGIKEEGHFTNALDREFYMSVSVFEEMWNDFLRKRFFRSSVYEYDPFPGE